MALSGAGETSTPVPAASAAVRSNVVGRHAGEMPPARRGRTRARQQLRLGEPSKIADTPQASTATPRMMSTLRRMCKYENNPCARWSRPRASSREECHIGCQGTMGRPRRLLYFPPCGHFRRCAASGDRRRPSDLSRRLEGDAAGRRHGGRGRSGRRCRRGGVGGGAAARGGGARPEHAGHLRYAGAAADRTQQPGCPNGGADGVRRGRRRGRRVGGGGVRLSAEGHPRGSPGGRHQAGGGRAHGDLGRCRPCAGRLRARGGARGRAGGLDRRERGGRRA